MDRYHLPVMISEVEQYLVTDTAGIYVDCTLGGGGHSSCLLEKYKDLRIIGLDWDEDAIAAAGKRLEPYGDRLRIVRENFRNIGDALSTLKIEKVNGVLADLGVSSWQFDKPERGFSFLSPNLDMRMDARLGETAEDMVNTLPQDELADIFYKYGEERASRPIARAILARRQQARITSGQELADIVARAKHGWGKIHPATQVFQALRIAVNRELESLEQFLDSLPGLLTTGGRAVIMSYHSLEDRIVKQNFRKFSSEGVYTLLTKKVVCAGDAEQKDNPRSRSAKLRCAERI